MTSMPENADNGDLELPGSDDAREALRRAREVVGLYGDPDITWGISIEVRFVDAVDLGGMEGRLSRMVAAHPHLGVLPAIERVHPDGWAEARERSATNDFSDGALVRILVSNDSRTFFVTAHHGVCDGFGLAAVVSELTGRDLRVSARGVGDRTSRHGFLRSSVLRLVEALTTPPARFSGTPSRVTNCPSERLVQLSEQSGRINGAKLCTALNAIHAEWPRRSTSGGRRFMVVMGASRREVGQKAPDRQTAYLRVPLARGWGVDEVTAALRAAEPEPDFPETSAKGIGPMVTRALKNRLGYTVNVANLGVMEAEGLETVAIFPAVNGPQAVGVGLVSTPEGFTISLRTRRTDFSDDEAQELLRLIMERIADLD